MLLLLLTVGRLIHTLISLRRRYHLRASRMKVVCMICTKRQKAVIHYLGALPPPLSVNGEILLALDRGCYPSDMKLCWLDKSLYKLRCSRDGWKYFAEPTFPTALLPTVHSPIVNRFPERDRGFTFAIEWDRGPPDSTRLGTAARENLPINNVPWIHPL